MTHSKHMRWLVVWFLLAVVTGGVAEARPQPWMIRGREDVQLAQLPPGKEDLYKDSPTIELVTMGIGSKIWERHGHIALCVYYSERDNEVCYNYGVGSFENPVGMAWGFMRGTHSFWVAKQDFWQMMAIYVATDRTVWRQPLTNLKEDQKKAIIDKLESDIREENKYYAYDHFEDNCTTRVRNILDDATNGELKSMTKDDTGGKTFRDYARDGFFDTGRPILLVTDLAMGRSTDRVPTYWDRMFLPQYLREAVAKRWGIAPIPWYARIGDDPTIKEPQACGDGSVVAKGADCTPHGPSGRFLFALAILGLTAPAWGTRLWGRFQRTGMFLTVFPMALIGTVFWLIAIVSPLPYLHINETCLILMPFDLLLLILPARFRVKYAQGRVGVLVLVALLMVIGVLGQPLAWLTLWPIIPAAIVGFWPRRT